MPELRSWMASPVRWHAPCLSARAGGGRHAGGDTGGRARVAWHVLAGRPASPDRALPKLLKAYGAADWATAQTYSTRGLSLEGYLAETFHRPDGEEGGVCWGWGFRNC
jgi:hypothetical protein